MDFDDLAADLVRRLGLDVVPWEDAAPEKWDEARALLADALRSVQETVQQKRGCGCCLHSSVQALSPPRVEDAA